MLNLMENNTLYCKYVHHVESSLRCDFVKKVEDCMPFDGGIPYVKFIYCSLGNEGTPWAVSLTLLWLGLLFLTLAVIADGFLCPALIVITKTLGLSENIAGITFLALGNGSPDIFSSVVGVLQGRAQMVIGQLFGGGIFVTTVVAGSICIYKPFNLMQRPFLRDSIFYISAVYWMFCVCYYGKINLLHSVGFLLFYCVYALVVIFGRTIYKKYYKIMKPSQYGSTDTILKEKGSDDQDGNVSCEDTEDDIIRAETLRRLSASVTSHRSTVFRSVEKPDQTAQEIFMSKKQENYKQEEKTEYGPCKEFLYHVCPVNLAVWHEIDCFWKCLEIIKIPAYLLLNLTVPIVDYNNLKNNWCKILNTLHCVTGPICIIFLTRRGTFLIGGLFPMWGLVLLFSLVLVTAVYFTTDNDQPPKYHWAFGYFGFLITVFWIYAVAREVTIVLRAIGIVLSISDVILGLTFLAWGNSIGDLISNVSVATQGFSRMGFSACYGGPMSTLLLSIGMSFTIYIVHHNNAPIEIQTNFLMLLLYGVLLFILMSTLIFMVILRFEVKRWYGIYLITIYVLFLTFALLVEIDVIT